MQDEEEQTQDHVPRQASNPAAKPSRMATLRQVSILSRCIMLWQSCTLHVQSALGDAKLQLFHKKYCYLSLGVSTAHFLFRQKKLLSVSLFTMSLQSATLKFPDGPVCPCCD